MLQESHLPRAFVPCLWHQTRVSVSLWPRIFFQGQTQSELHCDVFNLTKHFSPPKSKGAETLDVYVSEWWSRAFKVVLCGSRIRVCACVCVSFLGMMILMHRST